MKQIFSLCILLAVSYVQVTSRTIPDQQYLNVEVLKKEMSEMIIRLTNHYKNAEKILRETQPKKSEQELNDKMDETLKEIENEIDNLESENKTLCFEKFQEIINSSKHEALIELENCFGEDLKFISNINNFMRKGQYDPLLLAEPMDIPVGLPWENHLKTLELFHKRNAEDIGSEHNHCIIKSKTTFGEFLSDAIISLKNCTANPLE